MRDFLKATGKWAIVFWGAIIIIYFIVELLTPLSWNGRILLFLGVAYSYHFGRLRGQDTGYERGFLKGYESKMRGEPYPKHLLRTAPGAPPLGEE